MELSQIIPHIEALVFASDKPLSSPELVELVNTALGFIEDRASMDQVESALEGIKEKYNSEFYSFELKQSGGGWQFLTKPEYHKTVALINADKFIKRLSAAALETLAIIAYKQPITKSEIESIRGVNCDYAVQKLLEKDLVIISGRNENAVGKPLLYATSKSFMDYFGINSADELPKISEVLMEEMVNATVISDMNDDMQGDTDNFNAEMPTGITVEQATVSEVTVEEDIVEEVIVEEEPGISVSTKETDTAVSAAEMERRKKLVTTIKEDITTEE
ncbi:MAG: SMC-Scp complex subunit ScpB [Ferruginibacter sp.]